MSETGPQGLDKYFGRLKKVINRIPQDPNADIFQRQRLVTPPPSDHLVSERTLPIQNTTSAQEDVVIEVQHKGENNEIIKIK